MDKKRRREKSRNRQFRVEKREVCWLMYLAESDAKETWYGVKQGDICHL